MENITSNPHLGNLPKVLLIQQSLPVYTLYESEFSQHFHFLKAYDSPLPLSDFLAAANATGVTALFSGGFVPITTEMLNHLPALRCIVTSTAGLNQIDLPECRRRGIAIASAGEAYSTDCADLAVGLLIDVLRKVSSGDRYVRSDGWSVEGQYCLGNRVAGKLQPENLPNVLLLNLLPIYTLFETEFSRHFHFIKPYDSSLPLPDFLAAANSVGVTAMLIGGHIPITAGDVLNHLPNLHCIVTITAGLNHIDLAECGRRGIVVSSAGDAYSDDCADFAGALYINVLRKVSAGDQYVRRGGWNNPEGLYCLGRRLRGKKVGIIGLGSIGSRIAKRLEAFGCTIMYNSRKEKPSVSYPYYSDVRELATNSDALIISCALTDQTRHMINNEMLSALGKEGVIINIARGPIIDENELLRFLAEGKIAGAGLDVFEKEPSVPKELLAMDNVVLSPHAAFLTHESFRDVFELVKGNLQAFFSNKPLLSPVMDE